MTPQQIADTFIGMAAKAPNNYTRSEILRRGAATFAGMASDPKLNGNAKVKHYLTKVGLEFAGASSEAARETTSDFTQLLRDTAEAWNQLGPDAAFAMSAAQDATAAQRGIAQANDPGKAPRMSIAPASWNIDATLGRSVQIAWAPDQEQIARGVQQQQTVAFWQGQKQESQAMSIDFGTVLPPFISGRRAAGLEDSRPFAVIQYGADGNTQNSVTMDIGLGRRVTVVGNYISVNVGMAQPRTNTSSFSPELTVGASIGAFQAFSGAPVTRTIYIDELAAGVESDAFQIPLRAVTLLPPLAASPTDTLTVTFLTYNEIPIGQWESVFSPATPFWVPYPIPADAYFFTVTSVQGVPTPLAANGIRIPFQLSL